MAYEFSQSPNHQYLQTTGSPAPQWNAGSAFSISLWFKAYNVTDQHNLLHLWHSGTNNLYALIAEGDDEGDKVKLRSIVGGSGSGVATITAFSANTWHHVLASVSGISHVNNEGDLDVSIDGNWGLTKEEVDLPSTDESSVMVSGNGATYPAIAGCVAEVAIYNVQIASEDVDALSLRMGYSPLLIKPHNLIFYAPLRGGPQEWIEGLTLTPYNSAAKVSDHPPIRL